MFRFKKSTDVCVCVLVNSKQFLGGAVRQRNFREGPLSVYRLGCVMFSCSVTHGYESTWRCDTHTVNLTYTHKTTHTLGDWESKQHTGWLLWNSEPNIIGKTSEMCSNILLSSVLTIRTHLKENCPPALNEALYMLYVKSVVKHFSRTSTHSHINRSPPFDPLTHLSDSPSSAPEADQEADQEMPGNYGSRSLKGEHDPGTAYRFTDSGDLSGFPCVC